MSQFRTEAASTLLQLLLMGSALLAVGVGSISPRPYFYGAALAVLIETPLIWYVSYKLDRTRISAWILRRSRIEPPSRLRLRTWYEHTIRMPGASAKAVSGVLFRVLGVLIALGLMVAAFRVTDGPGIVKGPMLAAEVTMGLVWGAYLAADDVIGGHLTFNPQYEPYVAVDNLNQDAVQDIVIAGGLAFLYVTFANPLESLLGEPRADSASTGLVLLGSLFAFQVGRDLAEAFRKRAKSAAIVRRRPLS